MSTRYAAPSQWQQVAILGAGGIGFDVADFIPTTAFGGKILMFSLANGELILKTTRVAGLPALNRKLPARHAKFSSCNARKRLSARVGQNHWLDPPSDIVAARGQNDERH